MKLENKKPFGRVLLKTAGLLLLCRVVARADNCGSFSDCFGTVAAAAAAIASIATGTALLSALGGLFGSGSIDDAIPGADTALGIMNWSSGLWESFLGGLFGAAAVVPNLPTNLADLHGIAGWGGLGVGAIAEAFELADMWFDEAGDPNRTSDMLGSFGIDVLGAAAGAITGEAPIALIALLGATPLVIGGVVVGTGLVLFGEGQAVTAIKQGFLKFIRISK